MKRKYVIVFLMVVFLSILANSTMLLAQTGVLKSLEDDINAIVESIKPSLVTIQTKRIMPLPPGAYRGTFRKEEIMGAEPVLVGSGIVYDKDGHILTTTSVIGGRESFTVTLPDGKKVEGKLVGVDPEYNLAVLKVDASGLVPAKLGYSDKLKVGSWLTIVGNSYGLPLAVALGVMNGQRKDGFIQMSANVSPGNSGGPVLNTRGEVVGLVSAKVTEPSYISSIEIFRSESEGFSISPGRLDLPTSGVSLGIPINEAKIRADEIIRYGSIKRGYLGVYITDLTEEQLSEYKIESGVMIDRIEEGSPAQEGGLVEGDIILSYDGKKVQNSGELSKMIKQTKPQTQVSLEILRDEKKKPIRMTLGESESRLAEGSGGSYYDVLNRFGRAMSKSGREYDKGLKGSRAALQKKIDKLEKELQELREKIENTETND